MWQKIKYLKLFALFFIFITVKVHSQVEGLIIEKYYLSDENDETDTIGGKLPAGSITYRVFIDLKPGSKLKRIFGDAKHPLIIKSNNTFWNNAAESETFSYNISKARYSENTVALDSWLTIGQTCRSNSATTFGVLKSNDLDGSIIGGLNNDGGSAEIVGGLLKNDAVEINIPLTKSDGMAIMNNLPSGWVNYGFVDSSTGEDTTIFGLTKNGSLLYSENISLQNSGVAGVVPDLNHILIAQLTTLGEFLELEFNVEIIEPDGAGTKTVKYFARDSFLDIDEFHSPFLKYPYECGCKDPNYLEARKKYACENKDSCKTLIVFGCMDTIACNYNSNANYHIQTLCCYFGLCNDLDLNVVCPNLSVRERKAILKLEAYPTLVSDILHIDVNSPYYEKLSYQIIDSHGSVLISGDFGETNSKQLQLQNMKSGLYLFRLLTEDFYITRKFIKL